MYRVDVVMKVVPVKIPAKGIFVDTDKLILKSV